MNGYDLSAHYYKPKKANNIHKNPTINKGNKKNNKMFIYQKCNNVFFESMDLLERTK